MSVVRLPILFPLRSLGRRLATAVILTGALGAAVAVTEVAFVRELSDLPDLGALLRLERGALALALFMLIRILLGSAVNGLEDRFGASLENRLRLHLFRRLLRGSPFARLNVARGAAPDELIGDTTIAVRLPFAFVNAFVREPIRLVGFTSALAGAGIPLLVFLLIIGAILGAMTRWIGGALGRAFERHHQHSIEALLTVREGVEHQPTWMSCGEIETLCERLGRQLRAATQASFASARLSALLRLSLRLGYYCAVLGGTWFAARLVGATESLGQVASLGVAAAWLQAPIASLVELRRFLIEARPSIRRLAEIEDLAALDPDTSLAVPIFRLTHGIRARNVAFSYPGGRSALRDISLELPSGASLGISGPSGSGKTTLIRLLARLMHPDAGTILYDDADLRRIAKADLRRLVGVMLQPPDLVRGSLRENLTLGASGVAEGAILTVLDALRLGAFLGALPAGLDTPMGDASEQVSSGQRTRIALARVLLENPRIVLLDEPTALLDLDTGTAVIDALGRFLRGRTACIASNDPRVLALCGRVARLSAGMIDGD
ncbi:MAG: ABC transporter ATP-binding protein [Vicinamibacteria bacterium]|nr:ABC transporter ATP-binding protein [Vicinamibacteria bacterium]